MAHATTSLAYSKDHMFALRPTYVLYVVIISSIQNLLHCSLTSCEHMTSVTMLCDL